MPSIVLQRGDRGSRVKTLQRAINKRRRTRGLDQVTVDGDLGSETWAAWRETYEALGGKPGTFDGGTVRALRRYAYVRFPGTRGALALARAKKWKKAGGKGPAGALAFGRRYLGKTESGTSNLGAWGLASWIKQLLGMSSGVPWCGVYVWACLSKGGGVKGLTAHCASVYYIYADSGQGINGWRSRHGAQQGKAGDAVVLFSTSTHVELIEKRAPGGYITLGGNTSSGSGGNQANGGGCYRRFRPYSSVVACCRPRY